MPQFASGRSAAFSFLSTDEDANGSVQTSAKIKRAHHVNDANCKISFCAVSAQRRRVFCAENTPTSFRLANRL
jgi:hypothetical protein